MKIKRLQTKDTKGLAGTRHYDFSKNKVAAFCCSNGTGKTSVLKALIYVLTGQKPSGELVYAGASSAAVQVDFEDGTKIARLMPADSKKPQKFYVGEKTAKKLQATTLTELNKAIAAQAGREIDNSRIIASSELLRALTGQQLSDLLMSYIPELLTKRDIMSRIKILTAGQENLLLESLPEGEFGVKVIDELYKKFYEERKKAKQRVTEGNAVIRNLEQNSAQPKYPREKIEQIIADLQKKRDEAVQFSAKMAEYQNLSSAAEKHKAQLTALDEQIAKFDPNATRTPQEERDALANDIEQAEKEEKNSYAAMQECQSQGKVLQKAIRTISQQVCPLSDRLICTTDKTSVVGDLQAEFNACGNRFKEQKQIHEAVLKKIAEGKEKLKAIDETNRQADRLDSLKAERERLLETTPVVPEKPEQGKSPEIYEEQIRKGQMQLAAIENVEKIKAFREQAAAAEEEYRKYSTLVEYFSPKGEIKKAVTEFYLDSFAAPCNEKAEKLFHGMNLRFLAENGVTLMVDMGTGNYLSFESLSEGEKVCVTFLMMSMLSELSGFRVLILDELSVLDDSTFRKLLDVLKEHEAEYDLAVLACVDHSDTVKALEENGVPIIKC